MKKWLIILLVLAFILSSGLTINASSFPKRDATEVEDVTEPYEADEYIVSPDDEPTGDESVSNAKECDIRAVIACYDDKYIRVDILLENSITYDWDIFYAIKLEYDDMNEYYTYYTDKKKLVYEKEEDGEITETKTLTDSKSKDSAGVTDAGKDKDSDVYFIINKKAHIGGEKGKKYYLTCSFMSGFLNDKGKMKIADNTDPVNMYFVF